MNAAILEIRDGTAVGPMHVPAEAKPVGNGNIVQPFDPDSFPLSWPSVCGVEGYVYDREGLRAHQDGLSDCFECRLMVAVTDSKPRRPRIRSKHRPRVRVCAECGTETSRSRHRLCRDCYLAQPGPECGTRSRYVMGCRCPACTGAEREYAREYKRARKRAA